MSRAKRLRIAGGLSLFLAVQGAALWVFRTRESAERRARAFEISALDGREQMPRLDVERRDETRMEVPPSGPRLIHFWATWCPPCRDEMPVFAELVPKLQRRGIEVLAVNVDEDWPAIERFFGGRVPSFVVRAADREVLPRFGAGPLPDSFLVSSSGAMIGRIRGARDWSAAAAPIAAEVSKRR